MELLPVEDGPVVVVHPVTPPVPVIAQLTAPDGAVAFVAPVTVALNVIVPPSARVPDCTTATFGIYGETTVEVEEAVYGTGL